jgi:hypothetical protein
VRPISLVNNIAGSKLRVGGVDRSARARYLPGMFMMRTLPGRGRASSGVRALAVAFGALDAEHVELALDVGEDEIGLGHLSRRLVSPATAARLPIMSAAALPICKRGTVSAFCAAPPAGAGGSGMWVPPYEGDCVDCKPER